MATATKSTPAKPDPKADPKAAAAKSDPKPADGPEDVKTAPGLPGEVDATPEELDVMTATGVTLAQLRAIRRRDEIDADAIVAHRDNGKPLRAGICGVCFPQGWPNGHADHAECEHGEWDR
jgi:hypothetical protein